MCACVLANLKVEVRRRRHRVKVLDFVIEVALGLYANRFWGAGDAGEARRWEVRGWRRKVWARGMVAIMT